MAGHLIRRLNQISTHVFLARMKDAGLDITPVQFAAMLSIRDTPGIDQATVAEQIAYDRATIGGVIDRLEKKGWITRSVSRTDRRAREVSLSDEGAAMLAAALPIARALQTEILAGLSETERKAFLDLSMKALGAGAAPRG